MDSSFSIEKMFYAGSSVQRNEQFLVGSYYMEKRVYCPSFIFIFNEFGYYICNHVFA